MRRPYASIFLKTVAPEKTRNTAFDFARYHKRIINNFLMRFEVGILKRLHVIQQDILRELGIIDSRPNHLTSVF